MLETNQHIAILILKSYQYQQFSKVHDGRVMQLFTTSLHKIRDLDPAISFPACTFIFQCAV
jgi:hypothetical protein